MIINMKTVVYNDKKYIHVPLNELKFSPYVCCSCGCHVSFLTYNGVSDDNPAIYRQKYGQFPVC